MKLMPIFFKILFIYSREREAETQAEGEAGSTQGAQCGTRSQVSRIRPWAEGKAQSLSHPGCPSCLVLREPWNIVRSASGSQRSSGASTELPVGPGEPVLSGAGEVPLDRLLTAQGQALSGVQGNLGKGSHRPVP